MNKQARKGHFFHITHDKDDNNWHVKEEAIKKAEDMAKKTDMGYVAIHDEREKFKIIENL